MRDFANLWIWERVGDRLPWYYAVATNRMPAKFLIARRVPVGVDLAADEGSLWEAHARATSEFLDVWRSVRSGDARLTDRDPASPSLLDLSAELTRRMLRHCNFCRWDCGVDRWEGTKHGTCQLDSTSRLSSYFHHTGEELVLRGIRGSGTIFLTSCNLRCQFCQNGNISHDKDNGIPVTPEHLAAAAWQLRMEGCHNVNWVGGDPTIHLHSIVQAIALLPTFRPLPEDLPYVEAMKSDYLPYRVRTGDATYGGELNVPMLWNSNFFMSEETMRLLRPLIDVWLPDFKFGGDRCSIFLSRTPWYMETASRNHKLVYDWGEDVVIRHLVMPGHVECCTKPVLRWIAENMPEALLNVMDQYHPDYACNPRSAEFQEKYRGLARRPHLGEVEEAYAFARRLGLRFEDVTFEKATLLADWPLAGW